MDKPTFVVRQTDLGETIDKIETDGTVWSVPKDPNNSDYQQYLKDTQKADE